MPWYPVCDRSDLKEGIGKYVKIGDRTLAVFLHDGNVYAIDDRCPHAGASLSAGHVANGCAVCPRHDWAFRLDNGQLSESEYVRVGSYPTRAIIGEAGREMVEAYVEIHSAK